MTASAIIPLEPLLHRGQHIRAEYADGAWGQSTDEERLEGGLSGTLWLDQGDLEGCHRMGSPLLN